MPNDEFFNESLEQSRIKAAIVAQYFWVWAKIIIPTVKRSSNRIAYIDLFAGPGRYDDGTKSTPLMVLEQALQDEDMRQMLVTMFNDRDADNTNSLREAINALPGINNLRYRPSIRTNEVGEEIVKMFEQHRLVPTLFFVDPWGYRGLSLRLINSVLKDWGCDCIFFFNYNRINMGLGNNAVSEHMNALFGQDRANQLRQRLEGLSASERELTIVNEIAEALKEMGGKFVLPFRFRRPDGNRTSHHLLFVSKHFKGYEVMKEVMAKQSSNTEEGVASFEYNPASERQALLFAFRPRPIDDLKSMLLRDFSGQHLTMLQIYERHSVDTPYIKRNYKDALLQLEQEGRIVATPTKRRKNTFADDIKVSFP